MDEWNIEWMKECWNGKNGTFDSTLKQMSRTCWSPSTLHPIAGSIPQPSNSESANLSQCPRIHL